MTVNRSDDARLGRKSLEMSPSMREIIDLIPPEEIVKRHGVIRALWLIGLDPVIEVIGIPGIINAIGVNEFRNSPDGLKLLEMWNKRLTMEEFRALFQK